MFEASQLGREQVPATEHVQRQVAVAVIDPSALSHWFCDRVGSTKGRLRRIAVVALARKLLVALWRFVTTGLIPTGATTKPA